MVGGDMSSKELVMMLIALLMLIILLLQTNRLLNMEIEGICQYQIT